MNLKGGGRRGARGSRTWRRGDQRVGGGRLGSEEAVARLRVTSAGCQRKPAMCVGSLIKLGGAGAVRAERGWSATLEVERWEGEDPEQTGEASAGSRSRMWG